MELWQLKQMQGLPLEIKIEKSKLRIREWYEYWEGNVYVSFSGGKDSTVLLHLVRSVYPDVPAVFADTGLEYPEIREFVKTVDNVMWVKPKKTFREVINDYGYPVISKEQSQYIREVRETKSEKLRELRLKGRRGSFKISEKWKFLIDAPFKISERCCHVIKKEPLKIFQKQHGLYPFVGTTTNESLLRMSTWLNDGCNSFNGKTKTSKPISFWLESDIWKYIKTNEITYSEIYDMGVDRTGCMFCMFGMHLEGYPNRFQKMQSTHPRQYDYCLNKLGLKQVLEYIKIPYEADIEIKKGLGGKVYEQKRMVF